MTLITIVAALIALLIGEDNGKFNRQHELPVKPVPNFIFFSIFSKFL